MVLAKINGKYMFAQAGVLQIGDSLIYDIDNKTSEVVIETIGFIDEITSIYNLSVDPYDLFIAGDIVTHNKKGYFQGPTKRDILTQ